MTATLSIRDLLTTALATGTAQITDPQTGETCELRDVSILSLAGHLARTPTHREGAANATLTVETADPEGVVVRVGPFTRYELTVGSKVIDRCAEGGCFNRLPTPDHQLWCTEHVSPELLDRNLSEVARWADGQRAEIQAVENWTRTVADEVRARA